MNHVDAPQRLSTAEVARLAVVHKDTLLRWLRAGFVRERFENQDIADITGSPQLLVALEIQGNSTRISLSALRGVCGISAG